MMKSFKYRLEQKGPRTGPGGITRGASVHDFPASVGIGMRTRPSGRTSSAVPAAQPSFIPMVMHIPIPSNPEMYGISRVDTAIRFRDLGRMNVILFLFLIMGISRRIIRSASPTS